MFIPKGQAVHENLATRYLILDALVGDLCDNDFSGVVLINFSDRDSHILLEGGTVAIAVEKTAGGEPSKTTVSDLVRRAGVERGMVSIFAYPATIAGAIAGRFAAEPLYTNLSTDFADLEKLVHKLLRESDREWFVEVTSGGDKTLIHLVDDHYAMISSSNPPIEVSHQAIEPLSSSSLPLGRLVARCHEFGGTFDVFFRPRHRQPVVETRPPETPADENILASENPIEEIFSPSAEDLTASTAAESNFDTDESQFAAGVAKTSADDESPSVDEAEQLPAVFEMPGDRFAISPPAFATPDSERLAEMESAAANNGLDEAIPAESANQAAFADPLPQLTTVAAMNEADLQEPPPRALPTRELMALPGNFEGLDEAIKMADIRRLLGKIIKTIEEVHRGVEQKDNFQIHLRAGQLKIADHYPFLDPFGSEFEYLDGEVVFIGKVEPEAFVSGLTDALIFAVTEAAQASSQPLRLRSCIAEELKDLLNRNREDFARFELDVSIKRIIGPQMWQSFSETS